MRLGIPALSSNTTRTHRKGNVRSVNFLDLVCRLLARTKISTDDVQRIQSADIRKLFLYNALIACYNTEASYTANETLKNFAKAQERDGT